MNISTKAFGTTNLHLPTLKSNIKNDQVFSNVSIEL